MLHHQIAVLHRQVRSPRLTWAGRAFLAALTRPISGARRRQLSLIITPARSCAGTPSWSGALDLSAADTGRAADRPGDPPARAGDGPRQPGLGLPADLR